MFKNGIKIKPLTISFGKDEHRFKWNTLDDHLTGGISSSTKEQGETFITYSGIIKNINNYSWSCLRSNEIIQDVSGYKGVKIKLKSDGRSYAFQVEYNKAWQDEKLSCVFQTIPDQWSVIDLKFDDFEHTKFSKDYSKKLNSSVLDRVLRYNFFVTDTITGSFKLEVAQLEFY